MNDDIRDPLAPNAGLYGDLDNTERARTFGDMQLEENDEDESTAGPLERARSVDQGVPVDERARHIARGDEAPMRPTGASQGNPEGTPGAAKDGN